jgi:hypothetical protein
MPKDWPANPLMNTTYCLTIRLLLTQSVNFIYLEELTL